MAPPSGVAKGAYILADAADGKPEVILMGTGSEVSLCVGAYEQLKTEGIKARVVSMPSWELFDSQATDYKDQGLAAGGESAGGRRAGLHLRLVAVCWTDRHASSACTASVPRRRLKICRRNSASPRTT